jgi:hypothetical protein
VSAIITSVVTGMVTRSGIFFEAWLTAEELRTLLPERSNIKLRTRVRCLNDQGIVLLPGTIRFLSLLDSIHSALTLAPFPYPRHTPNGVPASLQFSIHPELLRQQIGASISRSINARTLQLSTRRIPREAVGRRK